MAKKESTRKRPGDPGETFARVKMPRELNDPLAACGRVRCHWDGDVADQPIDALHNRG